MSDTSKAIFDKIYASLDKIDERDQLARELAEMVRDMYYHVPGDYEESPKGRKQFYLATLRIKSRELLKLYEEEKP
ncbi:hypothetical protein LCGC14_0892210 [marine sediment metagenome]|uniref:Uncharacterized protein n=1 Tax=marine sediment metagenome TaxID=412755 RepID=A0A0F9S5X1_9ZZZZ